MYGKTGNYRLFGPLICLAILSVYCNGCTTKNPTDTQQQATQNQLSDNTGNEVKENGNKLSVLEKERKSLEEKMENQRRKIYQLAQEYGSTDLSDRRDMMQQRIDTLQTELSKIETNRQNIETKIKDIEPKTEKKTDDEKELAVLQITLETTKKYAQQIRQVIVEEEARLTAINNKQQMIDQLQSELQTTKEMYNTVCDKILKLELTHSLASK